MISLYSKSGKGLFFRIQVCIGFCFLLISHGQSVFAQSKNHSVKGLVTDAESDKPLGYTTVRFFTQADSAFVSGALTTEDGDYQLELPGNTYYAIYEFIGYNTFIKSNIRISENGKNDLETVKLSPSAKLLDEVIVQGEKSSMELTLDKKIFNVGKDLANAGGTATDILNNVPSVAVDSEGNISLRGSGNVRILIDGKPSGLVSFKGGSGLQQLQGNMIERVEIITNPSARYEAEGMSGIINIVLKKERREGFNGSFDIITGMPENFGVAANVNYRRKNLNFFVNYSTSYRIMKGSHSQYQELYRNDSTFYNRMTMDHRLKGMYNNARAGLDYFFNDYNSLTAAYTWRISKGKRFSDIRYRDYTNNPENLKTITYRTQDEDETEPNSEYALTYKKTFKKEGQELVADFRYLDNWEESDQYFGEKVYLPDGSHSGIADILQHSLNDETEKQYLFQVDYVHPFSKKGKFETGLRSNFRDMVNDYTVTQQNENGGWDQLPGLTNYFIYNEQIHGAYGIVGNKVNKFSYQAGVRAEFTDVTTTLRNTNQVNKRDYFNFFPSVHFTYDLPNQHALQLSYSRRVVRPNYNDLSPFMTYSDSRNYWSGNPDLNPEYTDSYEIGHIKYFDKGSFTSSLYYRYTTGKIQNIRSVDDQGIAFNRPENLGTGNSYGAEFTGGYTPFNWWKLDGSMNFFRAKIDGSDFDQELQSDTYSWFARVLSRFTVLHKTDIQVRGNYEAPEKTPQGRRKAIAALDLAVSKDILNGNGTLTLNVLDVFNSRKYRNITEGYNFYTDRTSQRRVRQINLTLNYRLHQAKKKAKDISESDY